MHITLRPNEKIYINGAVLRVDRKVSLELMNDAVFLLESHVMIETNATTPLRRLYFIVQLMLIEPFELEPKRMMFNLAGLTAAGHYQDASIQAGLQAVADLVNRGRAFEGLKVIRRLLPLEDELIAARAGPASPALPAAIGPHAPAPGPTQRPGVSAAAPNRVVRKPVPARPAGTRSFASPVA